VALTVKMPPTSRARNWIAISGIALLNRLMTLRKRLVMSSGAAGDRTQAVTHPGFC
jgi:hypothetical protein